MVFCSHSKNLVFTFAFSTSFYCTAPFPSPAAAPPPPPPPASPQLCICTEMYVLIMGRCVSGGIGHLRPPPPRSFRQGIMEDRFLQNVLKCLFKLPGVL